MIVGYDVYHGAQGPVRGVNIGALGATTSQYFASYFSTISQNKDNEDEELNKHLTIDLGSKFFKVIFVSFQLNFFLYLQRLSVPTRKQLRTS